MRLRCIAIFALVLGVTAVALAGTHLPDAAAATGSATVRLVSLLDEIPDSLPPGMGRVHDIRLGLTSGNVLLLRHHDDFVALLPIERIGDGEDSLQYFYFREGAPLFWVLSRPREKGIRTVADGGQIRFNTSHLIWKKGPGFGWIYFPDDSENTGLKFSVVSGKSVDQADPRDTRYWVELGASGASGF
jgi:hypothetical protein